MDINERILAIVREKGPLLPVQVSKEINDSILMTSARLSELLTAKQIKISNIKVGGSPLYYYQGQESKLQNFVDNIHGKPKDAYNLLKQNKILRDLIQEPAIRVALREIKDFAVPLQVNYENKTEIFWRWYLTDSKEAESLIRNILSKKEIPEEKPLATKEEIKKEPIELKKEIAKKQKKIIDKTLFLKEIHDFFYKNKISIIETKEIKKNTEIDFVVELQTSIGNVRYFCKTKNKKKINESDISTAIVQAQAKNLPLLFLTNGVLTKKTNEMLSNEFKNITIRKI